MSRGSRTARRGSRDRARGAPEAPGPARWRRAAALAVLGWVALWPPLHRVLVARYEIHPWRLGGFAMYATSATTQVALFEPVPGRLRPLDEAQLDGEARRRLGDFRARRDALGRLVRPDAVADAVFAARPGLERLLVVVQRMWLDPASARIASAKTLFPYERGAPR